MFIQFLLNGLVITAITATGFYFFIFHIGKRTAWKSSFCLSVANWGICLYELMGFYWKQVLANWSYEKTFLFLSTCSVGQKDGVVLTSVLSWEMLRFNSCGDRLLFSVDFFCVFDRRLQCRDKINKWYLYGMSSWDRGWLCNWTPPLWCSISDLLR